MKIASKHILLSVLLISLLSISCSSKNADFTLDFSNQSEKIFDTDLLLPETDFTTVMENQVNPYLKQECSFESGFTTSKVTGNKTYWESFKPDSTPKGTVFVISGFCEFTSRYHEFAYYLVKSGYNVVLFDLPGHGKSCHYELPESSRVYIDSFSTYIWDSAAVLNQVAVPLSNNGPLYLYAHSLGGAIGTKLLEDFPGTFTKAVLDCPMLKMKTAFIPEWISYAVSSIACKTGKQKNLVILNSEYDREKDYEACNAKDKTVSSDRKLYSAFLRETDPDNRMYGATYSWVYQCIKGTRKIRKASQEQKIKTPVTIFMAQNDAWVHNDAIKALRKNIGRKNPGLAQLVFMPEVGHEMLAAKNTYLAGYMNQLLQWYK